MVIVHNFEHNRRRCTIDKVLYVPAYEISEIAFFVSIAETKWCFLRGMGYSSSCGNLYLLGLFFNLFLDVVSIPNLLY